MSEHDFEEAHYWWSIANIVDIIDMYGYTKVLIDIDKSLKASELEIELKQIVTED